MASLMTGRTQPILVIIRPGKFRYDWMKYLLSKWMRDRSRVGNDA
jgi:hypothetical protein